jgi:hypothetical protein
LCIRYFKRKFRQKGYSGRRDVRADGKFRQKGYSGRWDVQADDGKGKAD